MIVGSSEKCQNTRTSATLANVVAKSGEVDQYLESVPEERRDALNELRDACVELLTGFEELMGYGMPGYQRDGVGEIGFASQKQYISFYVLRTDVMAAHRDRLDGISVGKGCIRYRRSAQIDMDVVRSILRMTAETSGPVY